MGEVSGAIAHLIIKHGYSVTRHSPEEMAHEPSIAELASGGLLTCDVSATLGDAIQRMHAARASSVLVTQDDDICGIWSEGDVRRLDFSDPDLLDAPIAQSMSSPVVRIAHGAGLDEAVLLMKRRRLRRLLVEDGEGRPLGMITQADIVRSQGVEHYLAIRDIGSIVSHSPLVLAASLPLEQAVIRMREANADAAVIDHGNGALGIFTEHDMVAWLAGGRMSCCLGEAGSSTLLARPQGMALAQALELLREQAFRHLGVLDEQGELRGLLSFADIMAGFEHEIALQLKETLKARDKALRASAEHLRLAHRVINASMDSIMITDARGVIQSVNPSFTVVTGYSAEEAVGNRPSMLSSGRQTKAFYCDMWSTVLERDYWQGEIWNQRKDGETYPEWLTITAIRDDEGQIQQFVAIFSDISDRKRREAKLHRLANFDDLTGLANRRLFLSRLEQAQANARERGHCMAVLFLDLDLFKRINDTLGHHAGDRVISTIATRLQALADDGESVARLGGDEFAVLIHEIAHPDALEAQAARLLESLCRPIEVLGHTLSVSASIGIGLYPEDGESAEILLKHANTAMSRAKEAGRNQWCFYQSDMGEHDQRALTLEQSLRRALDNDALEVVYQPQAALEDKRLVGFEALLRWNDPELGVVSPQQFIPLAEKLGMIDRIGRWVLDRVCAQLHAWRHLARVPVAVNVSALQLSDRRFVDDVERCLARYALSPELIELELTESALLPNSETTHRMLQRLRDRGIRLLIDDFGTGYSSLAYLRQLPISTLKIDASFVRQLPDSYKDGELVGAILAMANALGLDVIAEGAETDAQADFLRAKGCKIVQGYWLSRPLAANAASEWLGRLSTDDASP